MKLSELKVKLDGHLKRPTINSRILLDRFRVLVPESRKTSPYNDDRYAPFYYYLGKYMEPKRICEVGLQLGLLSGCFLTGCQTVEHFLAFQRETDEFYAARLALANIHARYKGSFDFYYGLITDEIWEAKFNSQWDVVFINDEVDYDSHMSYLDMAWGQIDYGGRIVVDYIRSHEPSKEAFFNFCKINGREPITMDTRYGTGILEK